MADATEKDDEAELAHLVMPRDPNLPATQLLELPDAEPEPVTHPGTQAEASEAGMDFGDTTLPGGLDEAHTLDEPAPPGALAGEVVVVAADWEDEVTTVVEDPAKPKG